MAAAVFLTRMPPGSISGVGRVSSSSGFPGWLSTTVRPFGTVASLASCGRHAAAGRGLWPARSARWNSPRASSCRRPGAIGDGPRLLLARHSHFGNDEAIVRARLERDTPARAIDHDLLEELEPGLFLVDDQGRVRIERLAFLGVERVARLLHDLVESLPVLG